MKVTDSYLGPDFRAALQRVDLQGFAVIDYRDRFPTNQGAELFEKLKGRAYMMPVGKNY